MLTGINFLGYRNALICVGLLLLATESRADVLDEIPAGAWYEVPNSELDRHFPNPPPPGWTGPRSVMDAWSGGAYDSLRDRLIVWGGGHMDYSGNELYVFDLNGLAWTRITDPTPDTQIIMNAARYADGRPSSRHTYNYLQYSPETDTFVSLGFSAGYGDPSLDGHAVDRFSFGSGRWEKKSTKPNNGTPIGSISAYDPSTGKLWHHGAGTGSLAAYDPVNDSWSGIFGSVYLEYYATAAINPTRGIMVATGGAQNNKVLVWDLSNPGAPSEPATSGDKAMQSAQAPGFVYDPTVDKFVAWSGGASVYTLDPETWQWDRVDPRPANRVKPTAANETGTYGRFQYIQSRNVYIAVNRTNENVFFYRLSGDGSGTPRPDPPGTDPGGPSEPEPSDGGTGALDPSMLLAMMLGCVLSRMRKLRLLMNRGFLNRSRITIEAMQTG